MDNILGMGITIFLFDFSAVHAYIIFHKPVTDFILTLCIQLKAPDYESISLLMPARNELHHVQECEFPDMITCLTSVYPSGKESTQGVHTHNGVSGLKMAPWLQHT